LAIDHEFGAQHTELKLSVVESYLKAFATAVKPHFSEIWYIDAFAGTGSRTVRVEAREGDHPTVQYDDVYGSPDSQYGCLDSSE
jgi:three-Cys-motif partner protein